MARLLMLTMNTDTKNRSLFSTSSISSFKGVQCVTGFVAKVSCLLTFFSFTELRKFTTNINF
jgi:hypothetical protein